MMNKPKLKIGVISDVVCPWCYIGKRRLETAISKLSDRFDFEVEYFPFELNPQIPAEGYDHKQYLTEKFGGEARYRELTDRVIKMASLEGLKFDYEKQKVSPNTRNPHRLIQLAKEDNKQMEMVEALFRAYFTEGRDLSKTENLVAIAAEAGLDREKVEQFLKSNTGTVEVEMAERELQQLGITGVPFYVIENKYGISGAQSPETFIQAFEEAAAPASGNGEACDVNGNDC